MGKSKAIVHVSDLSSVNFDKICRAALQLTGIDPGHIRVLIGGTLADVRAGIPADTILSLDEGRGPGMRSATEEAALASKAVCKDDSGQLVGIASLPGLVALCEALADHQGPLRKMAAYEVLGNLALLPERASELIIEGIDIAMIAMGHPQPLRRIAGVEWDEVRIELQKAELRTYEQATGLVRALQNVGHAARGSLKGTIFRLELAPQGGDVPVGLAIETENPNFTKHLWAALGKVGCIFPVATVVVSNPVTGRVAVMCSNKYRVSVAKVAAALAQTYGEVFTVNLERNQIVWDERVVGLTDPEGPKFGSLKDMQEMVSRCLEFLPPPAKSATGGATIADVMRKKFPVSHR